MSETCYQVNEKFNNMHIRNMLEFYHLGKEKRAKCEFLLNNNYATIETMVRTGDVLTIILDEEIDFIPENKHLNIIYEDEYLLIVDKPAGLMVHPDSKSKTGCLVNYVAGYYKALGINRSVKYLHRIDTDTSGLVMFAKDVLTASYFNYLISTHEIKRSYYAIISGVMNPEEGVIDLPIGEHRHINGKRRVSKTGQSAITYYKTVKKLKGGNSLVFVTLSTGRNHQIRVHFSHFNHPLLGDLMYGGSQKQIKRQALHSAVLDFCEPYTFKSIHLESPLPKDMKSLL